MRYLSILFCLSTSFFIVKAELIVEENLSPSEDTIQFFMDAVRQEAPDGIRRSISTPFLLSICDDVTGLLIAGCSGTITFGIIYTDYLWVDQQYRSKGYGRLLMEAVEGLGRRYGCTVAALDTFDFQKAVPFYERLGYTCDFMRDGCIDGCKCYFLKKNL